MDKEKIIAKFGAHYFADDYSYIMGIDKRFTNHLSQRFYNKVVLESCSGAGFSTIVLAKYAKHVYSIEIDDARLAQAKKNAQIAGVESKITFIRGDVTSPKILDMIHGVDAAFIDPDWALRGNNHIFRFINSNTQPPSDILLDLIHKKTPNITLVQPPYIDKNEFYELASYECEYLYLNGKHELYCLHFGDLAKRIGTSRFDVTDSFREKDIINKPT